MAAICLTQGSPCLKLRARSVVPFRSQPARFGACRVPGKRVIRVSAEEKDVEADVKTAQEPDSADGTFYNDERPLKPKDDMSPEFKKRLKDEYLSLGGSPNTAMGSNYFLWIIVVVSVLAVLPWALGYI